jgi:membrane protein
VSLRDDVVSGFAEHRLLTYASAIAYQVISSLVPFALFALALAGSVGAQSLWTDDLRPDVLEGTSLEVFAVVDKTVGQVLHHRQTFWVTFGLAIVLWELGGAVRATMEALDDIYAVRRKRSRTDKYVISTLLAAVVGALWLASLTVVLAGHTVIPGPLGSVVRYLLAALPLTAAVWVTLRVCPAQHQPVRWVSVGSVVIVAGWLIVVGGYVLYATSIASYGSVFGALATVFVLIVAAYLSAVVFLTGVLVDAKARDES